MKYAVTELAKLYSLTIKGDESLSIDGVCGISDNKAHHLSFFADQKKSRTAAISDIPVFLTRPDIEITGKTLLLHEAPEFVFCQISNLFSPSKMDLIGQDRKNSVISNDCNIDQTAQIGANVVIGDHTRIGARTKIFPNCVIMDRCEIGEDCIIYPNCTLREDTLLGNNVILQSGVSIGGDGYGFLRHQGQHVKIPQLGNVVIANGVEIGANTTIDRGRFTETRIGTGTKIDNLVMIGHNVEVGKDCLIVSQVGISGSTKLGDRVILAGQVGTIGHVEIGDDVTVLGKGGVTKSLPTAGEYAGMPARPANIWRKAVAKFYSQIKEAK